MAICGSQKKASTIFWSEQDRKNHARWSDYGVSGPYWTPSRPIAFTVGPDGNLWFTEGNANKIGRITTTGVVTEFPIPHSCSQPEFITAGPDGNLWFIEYEARKIGKITTSGVITEFSVPGSIPNSLYMITAGPDGNLWFAELSRNQIGRITPAGVITEFPLPNTDSFPLWITTGPDG